MAINSHNSLFRYPPVLIIPRETLQIRSQSGPLVALLYPSPSKISFQMAEFEISSPNTRRGSIPQALWRD
ncbi:unnamed protein product [Bursaphelenchus xylophilus]|uniref:(pine wood nematode) hypothetical protein n=1 Tax=Bursaphelenchus xylophilus TaxID=6326 RepID=A0A1I7RZB2_BURXY|nr:unnamed protein product [Bursaphelenchus xylophilus]CAG9106656.1 unnamed protein product [Bursaphelenchus xylophilus]